MYKDFGKSFYKAWLEAFYNYTIVLMLLFGKEVPHLHITLAEFYRSIYKLSIVYEWQEAVLLIAIKAHIYIVV